MHHQLGRPFEEDRRPDRRPRRVQGYRDVLDLRTGLTEPRGSLAHPLLDVGLGSRMSEPFPDHADAQTVHPLSERLGVRAAGYASLPRIESVGSGHDLEHQRVVGHGAGHRSDVIEGQLDREDAGVGDEPVGGLESDDAAVGGGDADGATLIPARGHVHPARRNERGGARRRATRVVPRRDRVLDHALCGRVASSRGAVVLAHRLADDLRPRPEQPRDHGRVDLRHVVVHDVGPAPHRPTGDAGIVLDDHRPALERPAARPGYRAAHGPRAEVVVGRVGQRRHPARTGGLR